MSVGSAIRATSDDHEPCGLCHAAVVPGDWITWMRGPGLVHVDCIPDDDPWAQAQVEAREESLAMRTHPRRPKPKFRRESTSGAGRRAGTG